MFLNVCKNIFHISHVRTSHIVKDSKRCFNMKSSTYYFHIKTDIGRFLKYALAYLYINNSVYILIILEITRFSIVQWRFIFNLFFSYQIEFDLKRKLWSAVRKKIITFLRPKYILMQHHLVFCATSTFFCWHEILVRATSTHFCRNKITFCATPNFLF